MNSACWYVAGTLYTADKCCLYLFVKSSKDCILLNSWLVCIISLGIRRYIYWPIIEIIFGIVWYCLVLFVLYKLGILVSFSLIQLILPVNTMYSISKSDDFSMLTNIVYICLLNHQKYFILLNSCLFCFV